MNCNLERHWSLAYQNEPCIFNHRFRGSPSCAPSTAATSTLVMSKYSVKRCDLQPPALSICSDLFPLLSMSCAWPLRRTCVTNSCAPATHVFVNSLIMAMAPVCCVRFATRVGPTGNLPMSLPSTWAGQVFLHLLHQRPSVYRPSFGAILPSFQAYNEPGFFQPANRLTSSRVAQPIAAREWEAFRRHPKKDVRNQHPHSYDSGLHFLLRA